MILQHLRNFEWLNEPQGVFFIDDGMKVVASDENFFFTTKNEDFSLIIKWSNVVKNISSENGIMIRIDEENYAKCYISYDKNLNSKLYCNVVNFSNKDIGMINIDREVYIQIKRLADEYKILYSYNLEDFQTFREFTFIKKEKQVQIGAYISSQKISNFEATLSYIDLR